MDYDAEGQPVGVQFLDVKDGIDLDAVPHKGDVAKLLEEPLLKQLSPRPSPFVRGLVACVGTDYCNLALIETKSRAIALSQAFFSRFSREGTVLSVRVEDDAVVSAEVVRSNSQKPVAA